MSAVASPLKALHGRGVWGCPQLWILFFRDVLPEAWLWGMPEQSLFSLWGSAFLLVTYLVQVVMMLLRLVYGQRRHNWITRTLTDMAEFSFSCGWFSWADTTWHSVSGPKLQPWSLGHSSGEQHRHSQALLSLSEDGWSPARRLLGMFCLN